MKTFLTTVKIVDFPFEDLHPTFATTPQTKDYIMFSTPVGDGRLEGVLYVISRIVSSQNITLYAAYDMMSELVYIEDGREYTVPPNSYKQYNDTETLLNSLKSDHATLAF